MDITLWGVRGSIASPSSETQFYGANTPCVEMRTAADDLLVFDAGTGLRGLGNSLPESGQCSLFLSHAHADHIQGMGFFRPFFLSGWKVNVYMPEWLGDLPRQYFNGLNFPVRFEDLQAEISVHLLREEEMLQLPGKNGTITVETFLANHPGGSLAYKVFADDAIMLYGGDHEITDELALRNHTFDMLDNCTVAIVDATCSRKEYALQKGWGHSPWEDWVELGRQAGVGRLILTHHAPDRTDKELDDLQSRLDVMNSQFFFACVAREGMRLGSVRAKGSRDENNWLEAFMENLAQYREESVILDRILAKARELTRADAGTVYLCEGDELAFAYTHNDSLFHVNSAHKFAYSNTRLPISVQSLAGYTASTGESINIPDAYSLPEGVPFHFNPGFDHKTGYKTRSILAVPIVGRSKKILGVIQLINCLKPYDKSPQPFSVAMEQNVRLLAREAANVLESGSLIRASIIRLMQVTSLHDPSETGPHAERVGAIAAEIYQVWAERHGVDLDELRYYRSQLRLAAMLHDVGKVGISDLLLKKKGKLTDEEFAIMKSHAWLGGSLFSEHAQDITDLAYDVAQHHHQKWDGSGYTGSSEVAPLGGEDIPLAARITTIADVFDALVSPRCYKKPWTFEEAQNLLRQDAGTHFDPELVECFLEIPDVISMIYARYPEGAPDSPAED